MWCGVQHRTKTVRSLRRGCIASEQQGHFVTCPALRVCISTATTVARRLCMRCALNKEAFPGSSNGTCERTVNYSKLFSQCLCFSTGVVCSENILTFFSRMPASLFAAFNDASLAVAINYAFRVYLVACSEPLDTDCTLHLLKTTNNRCT